MPYEIVYENLPVGVSLEAVRGPGQIKVRALEFVSEEDGDILIDRLEALGSELLSKLPVKPPLQPSQIQHLLAIIRRDRTATVYVNELQLVGTIQGKREFKKDDVIFLDDIVDVHRFAFEGVNVPNDAGVLLIFSVGWRRALFYDFTPLHPDSKEDRQFDLEAQLAQFYSYMMFQRRFKITENEWKNLFDSQWFPFITLKDVTIRNLLSHAVNGWPLDDLIDGVAEETKASAPRMLERWKSSPTFADHLPFLEKAVEHYLRGDFISTTAMVYPRVEGLLRTNQRQSDPTAQASQGGLSKSAVKKAEAERHASTPLLPGKFQQYLKDVYFAAFNPNDPKICVSRNSVGHGVASAEECSLKSATISLLLVDQLCYSFSTPSDKATGGSAKTRTQT
jgi:hypothetical protein